MDSLHRLLFVIGLLAMPAAETQAAFDWGYREEMINDSGADTASVIVKGTADSNQVANAASIEDVGVNSLNVNIDLLGGLDGSTVTVNVTNLIPFGNPVVTTPMSHVFTDGETENFTVVNIGFSSGAPTFASLLGGGNMIDLMLLDLSVADGFEAGVDSASIKLTITSGEFPDQTRLGKIGSLDPPFNVDPLLTPGYGGMTTLTVVPEPTTFSLFGIACFASLAVLRRPQRIAP